jgi:DNA-binding GntR family transcriptional regulator
MRAHVHKRAVSQAIASRSLRTAAYEEIKRRIITCEFRPGEVLSEAAVSAKVRIGRTPVHQAFDRLMMEGLVDVLPRKGVIVRPLSLDEVLNIIEIRLINETYCARLAAERSQLNDFRVLDDNMRRSAEAARRRDIAELMQLDRQFHDALSHAARNPILADLLRTLHNRSLRFWFVSLRAPDHHQRVLEQHRDIVSATRSRDPQKAEDAMRTHIEAFRTNIMRQL